MLKRLILLVGAASAASTDLVLRGVSDECTTSISSFGANSYTSGPWHVLLMYYWDPEFSPLLNGNNSHQSGQSNCTVEYNA